MKQYTLKLDNTRKRPVVILNNGLTALLDTGAYIPVWTDDEDILTSELGAELVRKDVPLSGFGGCTHGNLYKVNIDIGGILYPDMHIIANNEINATFNLILSATMFEGLIYQVDTVNHVLNIEVPDCESNVRNLRVINKEGKTFVLCNGLEAEALVL
ncbi:MAG: hypothetical protein NC517_07925 [Firmicutes bacterium]|nr:hypothetical protein [Bacillota bacterium]